MSKRKPKRDGVVESKRRDGTIVYSIRLRDATGRQHQELVGLSSEGWTRARAAEVCEERRVDVRREGLRHKTVGPTLAEYVPVFIDDHATMRGLKKSGRQHYERSLGRVVEALGERRLSELERRPDLIERWATGALRSGRYSARTINHSLSALSTLFLRARRAQLVRANPLEVVERPRVPEPNIKPADAAEVAALGAALDERAAEATDETERAVITTLRRMTTVAMSTGMRRGELLGLRWERVDLLTGMLRVEEGYSNHEFGDVKTSYSRRTLKLGRAARAALEAHYAASAFTNDDAVVFCHPGTGRPLDLARLNERYMRPALRKAGLADTFRPWHDQRHTALTFSAAVNLPYVVKNQAGHASSTTTDRYVRLAGVHLDGAADRTEALLFGAAEE